MKTKVPYIPNLESIPYDALCDIMEKRGRREYVANAPWPEFPYKPIVAVDLAADDDYLFVRFFVRGLGLKAEFDKTNEPVWQDSCVEMFIEDQDGGGYRNIEVNCIGTLLSSHQKEKGVDVKRIGEEDERKIIRISSLPAHTFKEKDGVHEWTMIIGIPFSLLGYKERPESLRANFYKCADGSRYPHYLCWSPIHTPSPNFHLPEFFGTLNLESPKA